MILFPKILNGIRRTTTLVEGQWTDTVETPFTFKGDAQPYKERDSALIPVGRHDVGKYMIFTDAPLQVSELDGPIKGDLILLDGRKYELMVEDNHDNNLISHYTYQAELRE